MYYGNKDESLGSSGEGISDEELKRLKDVLFDGFLSGEEGQYEGGFQEKHQKTMQGFFRLVKCRIILEDDTKGETLVGMTASFDDFSFETISYKSEAYALNAETLKFGIEMFHESNHQDEEDAHFAPAVSKDRRVIRLVESLKEEELFFWKFQYTKNEPLSKTDSSFRLIMVSF